MAVEPEHLYSLATAAYLVTSLVVAAVRWFHMCRPYDRNPNYYYPGRGTTATIHLCSLVLLPYVLFPESEAAYMIVKAYFLPVICYFLTILLFSYFGTVMQWRRRREITLVMGVPAALSLLSAPLLSGDPYAHWAIIGPGIIMTAGAIFALQTVLRWAKGIDVEEYSNPRDFPVRFAHKSTRLLVLALILLWVAALSGSHAVMAIVQLVLCVITVLVLITALHPQRNRSFEEEFELPSAGNAPAPQAAPALTPSKSKHIVAAIRRVVEEQEGFLDPHLTIQEVADRCGYSRTYIANILKTEFGGFFNYVNTLRLNYADTYLKEHPRASQSELAEESGFGSRQSFYTVRAKFRAGE